MRIAKLLLTVVSISLLGVGSAFADKQGEMDELLLKPWNLLDLPQYPTPLADVNETEPLNDTCPGEPYALDDVYHAAINPGGDEDWVCFQCNAGDEMTLGTDADGGLPTVDTYIELYDNTCSGLLAEDDDGGPGLFSLIDGYVAPYTGSYYLKVRGFSSSSVGNYIFVGTCSAPAGPQVCPVGLYKASKINVNMEISDTLGTIETPGIKFNPQGNTIITDVVIDICMDHTWVGDVTVQLKRTDSSGGVVTCDLIQRPGVPQTTFGCAGDLICDPENKYYFGSDPTHDPLGEFDCPSEIPSACYAVAIENPGCLEDYRDLLKGDGVWTLCITDDAAGDDGFIYNWSVHLKCEPGPVSVDEASFAEIKGKYRE